MTRSRRPAKGNRTDAGSGPAGSSAAGGSESDAWGEPASKHRDAQDPLTIAEAVRYERGLELGRGGMGRVVVARDRRLGRQVALKEVRPGQNQRAAAAQLAAEAQLAAGLDHPGILAIHDAGRDARGQPWYAMRLVRGKTLMQASLALPTLAERLRLMPALLAVCHAVAHAHERRIVHRDIKPDNLLVGPHGETQVADWGLACTFEQAALGGVVGTPEFMANEVLAGKPASPQSDVYSLGATLVAVLHGKDAELDRLAASLPPELAAIAERCLAKDPQLRYPDAAALAEDLSAWLDGRRVAAYSYSAWQLLLRLVRAFRLPLIVAAVALCVVAGVTWQGYLRTVNQRDRAIFAEQVARTAQAQSETANRAAQENLAAAYVQAAESAESAGAHPEAETLAAAAVALRTSPAARGILAKLGEGPEAALAADLALPVCRRLRLSPEGKWLLCIADDAALLLRAEDGAQRWRKGGEFTDGAISSTADRVLLSGGEYQGWLVDLATGETVNSGLALAGMAPLAQRGTSWLATNSHRYAELLDAATATVFQFPEVCAPADGLSALAFAPEPGALIATCRSGRSARLLAGHGIAPLKTSLSTSTTINASTVAVTSSGQMLLGTLEGRLFADGRELAAWSGGVHRLQPSVQSVWTGPGGKVAAVGEGLGPAVWSKMDEMPVRLPIRDRLTVAFADESSVVVAGERLRRFTLQAAPHPARFVASSGLSQIAVSRDGQLIAAAGGDGTLTIWNSRSGEVLAHPKLTSGVVKSVAFSNDGSRLAIGLAYAPGFTLLQVGTYQPVPIKKASITKRLGYFENGLLWRSTYGEGFDIVDAQGEARNIDCAPSACNQGEAVMNTSRTAVLHAGSDGQLTLIRQENPLHPELLRKVPWYAAIALSRDTRKMAVAEESKISLFDVQNRRFLREIADPGQRILQLAFSPDDTLLFVAELDRTVRVFGVADGVERALLRGHSQRVSQIVFGPAALGILTASWDGTVARWDLSRITADPQALEKRITARWGLTVEEALRAPIR